MKTCSKCGAEKPLDEYHRDKNRKNGRESRCKPCKRTYRAEHYARNREAELEHRADYYQQNQEAIRVYKAEYRQANRKAILARQAEYRARPEVKASTSAYGAKYRAANPHVGWERRARQRAHRHGHSITVESFTREDLTEMYGNACWHCGGEFEELDHYPTPISRGGHHVIENCKPSCTPCNQKSWKGA